MIPSRAWDPATPKGSATVGRARVGDAGRSALMVLDKFDEVAVEVLHEGDCDRPAIQQGWFHHRFTASRKAFGIDGVAIVGIDVQLPHRGAHIDRAVLILLLGELNSRTTVVGLQNHFPRLRNFGSAADRKSDDTVPKLDRALEIDDIDAKLTENLSHKSPYFVSEDKGSRDRS